MRNNAHIFYWLYITSHPDGADQRPWIIWLQVKYSYRCYSDNSYDDDGDNEASYEDDLEGYDDYIDDDACDRGLLYLMMKAMRLIVMIVFSPHIALSILMISYRIESYLEICIEPCSELGFILHCRHKCYLWEMDTSPKFHCGLWLF